MTIFEIVTFADQSFLALLALVGVFAIFKFQEIESDINFSLNAFRNFVKDNMLKSSLHLTWTNKDVDCWLEKDILVHLRSFVAKEKELTDFLGGKIIFLDALCDYYSVIGDLEQFKKQLSDRLKTISIGLLIPIICSKFFLLISFPESSLYLVFITIFSFLLVNSYLCLKYINFSLAGPRLRRINNPETNNALNIDYSEQTVKAIVEQRIKEKLN